MRAATLATALTGATLALASPAAPAPAVAAPRAVVTPAPFLPRGARPGPLNLAPRQGGDLSSVLSDLSSVFSDVTSALSSIHSDLTSGLTTLPRPTNGGFGPPHSSASADRSSFSKAFACQSALYSLGDTYPTPSGDLRNFILTAYPGIDTNPAQIDDSLTTYCSEYTSSITPPASLSSDFASYTSATDSWASAHKSDVDSLSQSCGGTQGALLELLVITDAGSCTSAVEGVVAAFHGGSSQTAGSASGSTVVVGSVTSTSGSAGATGTGGSGAGSGSGINSTSTGTGAGAASTSSSSTAGAAPRETGFVAAAAAVVVGFAGIVAAL